MKRRVRAVRDLLKDDQRLTRGRKGGAIHVTAEEARKVYQLIEGATYYDPKACDDDDVIRFMRKLWAIDWPKEKV